MTRQQILDLYFIEARAKLIDLAAFLDRVERATGEGDYRLDSWRRALAELATSKREKAKRVLTVLSDPTDEPAPTASGKSAAGAWPGFVEK